MKKIAHVILAFLLYPLTAAANPIAVQLEFDEDGNIISKSSSPISEYIKNSYLEPRMIIIVVLCVGVVGLTILLIKKSRKK